MLYLERHYDAVGRFAFGGGAERIGAEEDEWSEMLQWMFFTVRLARSPVLPVPLAELTFVIALSPPAPPLACA